MQLESYITSKVSGKNYYEFTSIGQKGEIRKMVMYDLISAQKRLYNLGFGDVDIRTGKVDDMSVSNNGDMEKVLITVGRTLLDFIENHPTASVTAMGSTIYRTRLYQMNILKFHNQIQLALNSLKK